MAKPSSPTATAAAGLLALLSSLLSPTQAADVGQATPPGVSPEQALETLQEGNARFAANASSHSNAGPVRRSVLATTQKPAAIVLSCSDSRVPPELIFDQGLGEIYTIRVAGHVLGAATVASIEDAVEQLGVRLIVVLGHESCDAIRTAVTTPFGVSAGSPDRDTVVSSIAPFLEENGRRPGAESAATDRNLRGAAVKNVDGAAERLVKRSRIVRKAVESGQVKVARAVYSLETGKVTFWNAASEAVKPASAPAPSHEGGSTAARAWTEFN